MTSPCESEDQVAAYNLVRRLFDLERHILNQRLGRVDFATSPADNYHTSFNVWRGASTNDDTLVGVVALTDDGVTFLPENPLTALEGGFIAHAIQNYAQAKEIGFTLDLPAVTYTLAKTDHELSVSKHKPATDHEKMMLTLESHVQGQRFGDIGYSTTNKHPPAFEVWRGPTMICPVGDVKLVGDEAVFSPTNPQTALDAGFIAYALQSCADSNAFNVVLETEEGKLYLHYETPAI